MHSWAVSLPAADTPWRLQHEAGAAAAVEFSPSAEQLVSDPFVNQMKTFQKHAQNCQIFHKVHFCMKFYNWNLIFLTQDFKVYIINWQHLKIKGLQAEQANLRAAPPWAACYFSLRQRVRLESALQLLGFVLVMSEACGAKKGMRTTLPPSGACV